MEMPKFEPVTVNAPARADVGLTASTMGDELESKVKVNKEVSYVTALLLFFFFC